LVFLELSLILNMAMPEGYDGMRTGD